jgi:hypothetical protein
LGREVKKVIKLKIKFTNKLPFFFSFLLTDIFCPQIEREPVGENLPADQWGIIFYINEISFCGVWYCA